MATAKVKPEKQVKKVKKEQCCFDLDPEQKKIMEDVRKKTGVPVAFQIRTGIDLYLKTIKK